MTSQGHEFVHSRNHFSTYLIPLLLTINIISIDVLKHSTTINMGINQQRFFLEHPACLSIFILIPMRPLTHSFLLKV